jgi:hypothetical protein
MQYEALYENGQITWLRGEPPLKSARIMVSILEDVPPQKRRQPSPLIAGKGKTSGDLVSSFLDVQDWE